MNIETEIVQNLRQASVASKDEESARRFVQEQLERLPPHRRGPVAMKLKQQFEQEQREIEASRAKNMRLADSLDAFADWWQGPFALEKNECSRYHRLQEAASAKLIYGWDKDQKIEPVPTQEDIAAIHAHCFVIRHDWASAFAGTEVSAGDIVAPYEQCAFEFRYSGHTVIVIWEQSDEDRAAVMAEFGEIWFALGTINSDHPLVRAVRDQVRAICISLDAEAATKEVVRAPAALNEKRKKQGKPPLADFHVVDLAKRHRIANPTAGTGEPSHRKRLHFVRGHWRHFETHKTWIKWHLRGNPDLGFIAKHYAL